MSVTFGGWQPAPEPDIDARMALAILPQFAAEFLRQQSPEGKLDQQVKQQNLDLLRQRLDLERQKLEQDKLESTARIGETGARTSGLLSAQQEAETMLPLKKQRAQVGIEHETAEAGKVLMTTPSQEDIDLERGFRQEQIKHETTRGKLDEATTALKLEEVGEIKTLRKGEQDYLSWNEASAPTTEGIMFAKGAMSRLMDEGRKYIMTLNQAKRQSKRAVDYLAAATAGEKGVTLAQEPEEVEPEEVTFAKTALAKISAQLRRLSLYAREPLPTTTKPPPIALLTLSPEELKKRGIDPLMVKRAQKYLMDQPDAANRYAMNEGPFGQ